MEYLARVKNRLKNDLIQLSTLTVKKGVTKIRE